MLKGLVIEPLPLADRAAVIQRHAAGIVRNLLGPSWGWQAADER